MKTLRTALLTATLLFPASALARPMTAEDVAKLESVGTIAVSPDGSRVAYTTTSLPDVTSGEKDGSSTSELKVAWGADAWRAYLPEDVSPSGVGFSPDGGMVTYLWSADDEKRSVWGVPVDGGAPRKLAGLDDSAVSSYTFSPDGGTLYLLVGAAEDKQRTKEKKAGFDAKVYEEEAQLPRLFAASVGTVVDESPRQIPVPGYTNAFDITPDGRTGIIQTAPSPQIDDQYTSKRVNLIDLATGEVKVVVETPGKLGDVEVSPDGSQMSMIAGVDMHDPADTTLHLVDVATGAYRALNAGAEEATSDAEWMADGTLVAVIHKGAQTVLRMYNADGSVKGEVDPGALIISDVEVGGGKIFIEANSPRHPNELFAFDGSGFTRWTTHNPWLADIDFGAQRTLTYTASDGQEIEGILIEPLQTDSKSGSATIMMIHGGPEAHYSNGWLTAYSMPGQVGAGKGYAVFHPNYRGSTGYGTAFSKQHYGNYTDPEFRDIVDAKNYLVDQMITDPDRTGITGGSYGGYASAWGATALSAEFAASVMFVGISNQVSKFGTTDIPYEMYNVHSGKWPWDDWMGLLEVSPVYHVDKAETPLLILHGEQDTRVDPGQSYELYRSIKVRKPDTPVRFVLYPGEPHGNRRAASRYDYSLRMFEWFDTYLKTGDRTAPMPGPRPDLNIDDGEED
ncbi:S9 family peptidase [Parerythrobacter aestuarii]|uniref:S9 family peptidase n=1 Tax=Parerythrobacter aestuarii TaxID=3020909 RepID=UPI0024DF03D6|nr:S9 family peptidase [Parerythrobacter aestuarii]